MTIGPFLIMFAASLWALDALIRTGLTTSIPSASIVLIEHIFGFILLIPIFISSIAAYKKLKTNDWLVALLLALVSGVGGTVLFTQALGKSFATGDFVTPILLQKTQPLFVTLLAALFLKERLTLRFLVLVPVALIGSYMVSFGVSPVQFQLTGKELVVLLSLGASLAWGSGTILSKTLLKKLSFPQATSIRFLLTIPIAYAASVIFNQTFNPMLLTLDQIWRFILIAFATGAGAILIYYRGLAHTEAKVSTFAELSFPIVSILIAITPLNPYGSPQVLTLANIFGICILLISIILISLENVRAGHTGQIEGVVVRGHGDGKKLGFPTANIRLSQPLGLPYGVYVCRVVLERKRYGGVMHWGPRLVFGEMKPQCEVYLFNFSKNIYGKRLEVEMVGFVRPSRNFSSLRLLSAQIRRDCNDARRLLRKR